jgi:hypothetical protein
MRSFRHSGAHGLVMPRLLDWCDEAAYVHWNQDSVELPDWREAHRRLVQEGKLSKVYHPSPAQVAKQIAEPKTGQSGRTQASLTPQRNSTQSTRAYRIEYMQDTMIASSVSAGLAVRPLVHNYPETKLVSG